jgi:hypothetical protein
LLAVLVVDKRPYLGGVLLGLSLIKPHLGVAFFLWTAATGRFKAAATAVGVVLAGLFVFSWRVGNHPISVTLEYIGVLRGQFGGESYTEGVFELRPLIHFLVRSFPAAEILNLAIMLVLAAIIGLIGLRRNLVEERSGDQVMLQLCCLWGLIAVFHNPYDSILMLPVMMGLYAYARSTAAPSERLKARIGLWVLQTALVLEVAGRWRTLSHYVDLSRYDLVGSLISHVDRVLVLGFFVFIAYSVGVFQLIRREEKEVLITSPGS